MTGLFDKNFKVDVKTREWITRYYIISKFKGIIECCNKDIKVVAKKYLSEFNGFIQYAFWVKDINEFTYNKLYRLTVIIKKKYKLY